MWLAGSPRFLNLDRFACIENEVFAPAPSDDLDIHRQTVLEPRCDIARRLADIEPFRVVEVLQRRDDRLYLNDGMYGIFWELRFKGHQRFAVRALRADYPTVRIDLQ